MALLRTSLVAFLVAPFALAASLCAAADLPQASWYSHPDKLYGIPVPPDAKAQEMPPNAMVINSKNGFLLRVQTAPASLLKLPEMAAKLEGAYLGQGKTWSTKIAQQETTVAGLPALASVYEGSRLRSKAVIARGAKTDFVFIFNAPAEAYNAHLRDFEWILENFRPAASEVVVAGAPKAPPAIKAATASAAPAAKPAPAPLATMPAEVTHFSEREIGYSIAYPGDWTATRLNPAAVLLGGKAGTDAYYATVGLQNVQPPKASGPQEAMAIVLAGLKSELTAKAKDVRFADEGPMVYEKRGLSLKAFQFVVSYGDAGRRYKQWTVIVPRPSETVMHVWSYRAPEDQFDVYRPIAEAIRQSWRIEVASAQPTPQPEEDDEEE